MWQQAASAGVSLLGGLLGSSSNRKAAAKSAKWQQNLLDSSGQWQLTLLNQTAHHTTAINQQVAAHNRDVLDNHSTETTSESTSVAGGLDLQRLVRESEAAGFNPLTVIRGGGLAGYSTTNTTFQRVHTPARELMAYFAGPDVPQGPQPGQAPQASPGNSWDNAFGNIAAAINAYDPYAAQRAALEMGVGQAQIANLNSDTARNRTMLNVPSWTAPSTVRSSGGFAGAAQAAAGRPALETEAGKITDTGLSWWEPAPWFADVASWAERHGEPAEWALSPVSVIADGVHNAGRALAHARSPAGASTRQRNTQYLMDTLASAWGAVSRGVSALSPLGGRNSYQ